MNPASPLEDMVAAAQARARARAGDFVWDPHDGAPPARSAVLPSAGSGGLARPLRLLMSDSGRSCFRALADSRVKLIEAGEGAWGDFDVLVVTRADRMDLEKSSVPASAWARVASGAAVAVFDASGEGNPHTPELSELLHGFLRGKGVEPHRAAYVTQDRRYGADYADYCRRVGLDGRGMRVWVHDLYIQRIFAGLADAGERLFRERLALHRARSRHRDRRFVSLNHAVRPAKAMFLLQLLADGLWDRGYVSVGPVDDLKKRLMSRAQFLKKLKALPGFEDVLGRVSPHVGELERLAPIRLGQAARAADISKKDLRKALLEVEALEEYQRSWFTVVTESHVTDRLHRITEKPFKALLNFHPIIVLGAVGSLELIRSYGFETYPQLFDESYDGESQLRRRFDQVYGQTVSLCRMDEAELARRVDAVEETLIFNAWWGLVELPRLFRSRIDPRLADLAAAMIDETGQPSAR